jgi:adenylate cyclase
MAMRWSVQVSEGARMVWEGELEGPLEIGRQDRGEPAPFSTLMREGRQRLIIARAEETDVGRRHTVLTALPDGRLRLVNNSNVQPIRLRDDRELAPGAAVELPLPVVLALGRRTVSVQQPLSAANLLSLPAVRPPQRHAQPVRFPTLAGTGPRVESKELLHWLSSAMDVLQAAAGAADFFDRAAAAVVDMADLDSAQVLLLEDGKWRMVAARQAGVSGPPEVARPSQSILSRLLAKKETTWDAPRAQDQQASLASVEAVVAAPVLRSDGTVLGALYGDRGRGGAHRPPLSELEAMLVQLVARSVAAGLARLEQEQAAASARVRFEQFFTPQLAEQLGRRPDWEKGRQEKVSVLFCDIWGFSRISERVGPEVTVKWIQDVLSVLSECVLAEGGVLVDYVGDALMALWGAPEEQPDHAARACRAALDMQAALPDLAKRWQAELGEAMQLSIGVNTGPAQVGNTGSRQKFKYGALGNTVNLASRVQGMTKHLRCRLLITHATRAGLDASFAVRRLGRFQVVNIKEPVEVYELAPKDRPGWEVVRAGYESALEQFESGEFPTAARALGNLRMEHADEASLVLLYRVVRCMIEGPPLSHPVWVLAEK